MQIRVMTIEDYDLCYELWTHTKGVGVREHDDSKERIEKYLLRNPKTCFVVFDKDRIIGNILSGHDGRRAYIYHACVLNEYQNKGIGTLMLNNVIKALKEEGINKACLIAFKTNAIGNAFWEKQGFYIREDLNYRDFIFTNDDTDKK